LGIEDTGRRQRKHNNTAKKTNKMSNANPPPQKK
jgi:hypothetical protein